LTTWCAWAVNSGAAFSLDGLLGGLAAIGPESGRHDTAATGLGVVTMAIWLSPLLILLWRRLSGAGPKNRVASN